MSTRRKQKRPDNILGWLFADPWRKLGAIVLALVSWEYLDKRVNADHTSTLEIRLPGEVRGNNYVQIDMAPEDYTLTSEDILSASNNEAVQQVKIEMKGEKATIDRMRGNLELVYRPAASDLENAAKTGFLTFGLEDLGHVKGDLTSDLKELDSVKMTPDKIRLRVRPNATKTVQLEEQHVQLDYGSSGLSGRLDRPSFSLPTIELRGPQEAIDRIGVGPIFVGKVGRVQPDATTVRIELELQSSLKDIVAQKVFVTYNVEPDWQPVEFRNVPIGIDNELLRGDQKHEEPFRVQPEALPVVRLDVKGELAAKLRNLPPEQLADFQRKHVRLYVYPQQADLKRKGRWPLRPEILFVRFDDIPTPRKNKDFRVRDLEWVNIIVKSEGQ